MTAYSLRAGLEAHVCGAISSKPSLGADPRARSRPCKIRPFPKPIAARIRTEPGAIFQHLVMGDEWHLQTAAVKACARTRAYE